MHSFQAPYKADGDASDLQKKGENSKGIRLRKYVVTSVTISLDNNSTVKESNVKTSTIHYFFQERKTKKEAGNKPKVSTKGREKKNWLHSLFWLEGLFAALIVAHKNKNCLQQDK